MTTTSSPALTSVSENGSLVHGKYTFTKSGLPYTRGERGSLVSGSYSYKVIVYDVSADTDVNRKKEEKTFTLNIDTTGPSVSISGPDADGAVVEGDTYTFSGRVHDLPQTAAATGVESMEYAFGGYDDTTAPTEAGAWHAIAKTTDGTAAFAPVPQAGQDASPESSHPLALPARSVPSPSRHPGHGSHCLSPAA